MGISPLLLGRPPRFSTAHQPAENTAGPWLKLSVFGKLGLDNRRRLAAKEKARYSQTISSTSSMEYPCQPHPSQLDLVQVEVIFCLKVLNPLKETLCAYWIQVGHQTRCTLEWCLLKPNSFENLSSPRLLLLLDLTIVQAASQKTFIRKKVSCVFCVLLK